MKKFFSLVLALVMALSLTTVAWADGATEVSTAQDLIDALDAGEDVVFANNIEIAANLSSAYGKTGINVLKGQTIDGAGYTLTVTGANGTWDSAINTTGGTIKNLTIPSGFRGIFINHNSTHSEPVILENVTIDGPVYTISCDQGMNQGLTATNCTFNGWTSFAATVGDVTFNTCSLGEGSGYAYCRPYAPTNFVGCDFEEDYAMDPRAAAALDACTVEGEVITAANLTTLLGDAAANATVTSEATAVAQVGTKKYTTVDAALSAANGADVLLLDDSATIPDGYTALANGTVVKTPATGATDPVLYVWDNTAEEWSAYYIATGKTLDKLAQDASDDCLPCYLINGEYFVEVKEAAATYKLVYGAKTVFLAPIAEKLVKYDDTASVLTVVDAEDAECGDYYVTNLDEDDVYYISYNKKGEVDGIWVKAKNGSEQILVNGKIVDAEDASSDVTFMFHKFKGYDVVNKQYTTVKCENCPKVAKLYANATAATVGKKDAVKIDTLGWITFADYMDFGANAPVVTDKVQSAETFDAGIAMYVGMSVMAAAGSAVVIGKKKD